MSRLVLRPRPALAALLACGAVILVLAPAHAGIGDLMKKAKDKAAQAVAGKPAAATAEPEVVKFDDVTVELTPARLDKIVEALQKANAANTARDALVARLDKLQAERQQLWDKNQKLIETGRAKRDEVRGCCEQAYTNLKEEKSHDFARRQLSGDPALRAKHAKAAAQYNEAAARGDSTAIAKLNEILLSDVQPTKEDSAAVQKKCGAAPPMSPAEKRVDDLDKQIADQQEQIRKLDAGAAGDQAASVGLTAAQWAMAMDRIQAFVAAKPVKTSGSGKAFGLGKSSKSSSSGDNEALLRRSFSQAERDAMEKRLEELRKLVH
jgi:hypothetical protein